MIATVIMDNAGRIVLPKPIRQRMRLRPGSRLKMEIVGDKIELSQEASELTIVLEKDGLPVVVGWEGFDAAQAVREMREEQINRLDVPFRR